MQPGDDKRRALVEKFVAISGERLARLGHALSVLGADPSNAQTAQELMREIHTLKGEAKLMGFEAINVVAHRTEDLLLAARAQGFRHALPLAQLIAQGLDNIAGMLDEIGDPRHAAVAERFEVKAREVLRDDPEPAAALAETVRPATLTQIVPRMRDSVRIDSRSVEQITEVVGALRLSQSRLEQVLRGLSEKTHSWREGRPYNRPRLSHAEQQRASRSELTQMLLSALTLVAEQDKTLAALSVEVVSAREEAVANRALVADFEERLRALRLVPISSLLNRFPRAMRDLAQENGKRVQVNIAGSDVGIDEEVLDQIGEPLMHLLRNCVDHGIELPDERRAAYKPVEGSITLAAQQKGAQVQITVSDDGRGIDAKRVLQAAVAHGVIDAAAAANMSEEAAIGLVFRAGLSTSAQVTDVSGRGVGLDVAQARLRALGGTLVVKTLVGVGTSFIITAPVSRLLGRALVMQVANSRYAMVSEAIHAVAEVAQEKLENSDGVTTFLHDDQVIAVADLAAILGVGPTLPTDGKHLVLIVEQRGERRGFIVDRLLGEQQMVQRRLDPFFEGLRIINGTAMLESGDLVLLLNAAELIEGRNFVGAPAPTAEMVDRAALAAPLVLVVDDSEVSRDLVVSVLRNLRYRVEEASDGADALQRLTRISPDLIITDVEMPVMDGMEFLQAVRLQEMLRGVPVVVFSTRTDQALRQQAASLGADAYLVKTNMREDELVRTITHLVAAPAR